MKKFKFLCLFVALSVAFSACSVKAPSGKLAFDLYYANSTSDALVTEKGYADEKLKGDISSFVKEIMFLLLKGPSLEGVKRIIPEGVYLRGASEDASEQGTVNIDLSGDYYTKLAADALPSQELLARYSIICTLCQFEEIKKVRFFVNGEPMLASSGEGEILGAMGLNSVMINSPSSIETKTEKFVTLYFTDKNGTRLYPETHKATMTDNSLAKTVVNELMRGPVSSGYERTFSDAAKLISVETTEGVCFVNFSADFIPKSDDEVYSIKTAVYSVVNSLTRLPDIEKVQILIDGKKPENDEYQLFSMPLERDERMITDVK